MSELLKQPEPDYEAALNNVAPNQRVQFIGDEVLVFKPSQLQYFEANDLGGAYSLVHRFTDVQDLESLPEPPKPSDQTAPTVIDDTDFDTWREMLPNEKDFSVAAREIIKVSGYTLDVPVACELCKGAGCGGCRGRGNLTLVPSIRFTDERSGLSTEFDIDIAKIVAEDETAVAVNVSQNETKQDKQTAVYRVSYGLDGLVNEHLKSIGATRRNTSLVDAIGRTKDLETHTFDEATELIWRPSMASAQRDIARDISAHRLLVAIQHKHAKHNSMSSILEAMHDKIRNDPNVQEYTLEPLQSISDRFQILKIGAEKLGYSLGFQFVQNGGRLRNLDRYGIPHFLLLMDDGTYALKLGYGASVRETIESSIDAITKLST